MSKLNLISAFSDEGTVGHFKSNMVTSASAVDKNCIYETIAADSPISGRQMQIVECNGIPVYVDLKDRVCLPVEEGFNVL